MTVAGSCRGVGRGGLEATGDPQEEAVAGGIHRTCRGWQVAPARHLPALWGQPCVQSGKMAFCPPRNSWLPRVLPASSGMQASWGQCGSIPPAGAPSVVLGEGHQAPPAPPPCTSLQLGSWGSDVATPVGEHDALGAARATGRSAGARAAPRAVGRGGGSEGPFRGVRK